MAAKREAAIKAEEEALEELNLASKSVEPLENRASIEVAERFATKGEASVAKELEAAEESLLQRLGKMSATSKVAVGVAAVVGAAALGHWAMKIKREREQNKDVAASPKR